MYISNIPCANNKRTAQVQCLQRSVGEEGGGDGFCPLGANAVVCGGQREPWGGGKKNYEKK